MKNKTPSTGSFSAASAPRAGKPAAAAAVPRLFTHEEIAFRARQLWEQRGRPEGQDEAIWHEAERELKQQELAATEDRRFAKPESILDADGDPDDDIDKRLDEIAAPRVDRSATSL